MKTCSKCGILKELSEFQKQKKGRNGLSARCRPCCSKATLESRHKDPESGRRAYERNRALHGSRAEEQRLYLLANPDKVILYGLNARLKRYKISAQEYEQMNAAQKGSCAICGKLFGQKQPAIDHCHSTGRVRGLLCPSCNTGLGGFKDSPAFLEKAIAYLRRAF